MCLHVCVCARRSKAADRNPTLQASVAWLQKQVTSATASPAWHPAFGFSTQSVHAPWLITNPMSVSGSVSTHVLCEATDQAVNKSGAAATVDLLAAPIFQTQQLRSLLLSPAPLFAQASGHSYAQPSSCACLSLAQTTGCPMTAMLCRPCHLCPAMPVLTHAPVADLV